MRRFPIASSLLLLLLSPTHGSVRDRARKHKRIKFQPPSPLIRVSYGDESGTDAALNRKERKLREASDYEPIRINFYYEPLLETVSKQNTNAITKARADAIINMVIPAVESIWRNTLSVIPTPNLVIPGNVCFDLYKFPEIWSNERQGLRDTDLLIFVSGFDHIGETQICSTNAELSTLAVSSPCAVDPNNDRPVVGFANVCLNTISMNSKGEVEQKSIDSMIDIMSHELVHVLGLNSELYKYFRNSLTGAPLTPRKKNFFGRESGFELSNNVPCVGGQSDRSLELACENTIRYKEELVDFGTDTLSRGYYEVVLPTVAQVSRNHFNCPSLQGARLENQPTSEDCTGSHFDERTWFTEFMSAVYDDKAAYFSPLTLAFLEDTGWYKCDFSKASNSPFGLGAGCNFVNDKCIVDEMIPSYGKGFFCNDKEEKKWTCGPSHAYRGTCDLGKYAYPERTYFQPNVSSA